MHWTARVDPVSAAEFAAAVDALRVAGESSPERDEQIAALKATAKLIVQSGCLGTTGTITAYFSGQANPGHTAVPAQGEPTTNDIVAVSVQRVS
jgi:hypothetical protein